MTTPHTVTIKHDPESHEVDCHDECTATLTCSGVTDNCRCWWECDTCREASRVDGDDADEYADRLDEYSEAHGVEHQHIDGMWMVPTDRCLGAEMESDVGYLVDALSDGDHPVELDCEDGFVYVRVIEKAV